MVNRRADGSKDYQLSDPDARGVIMETLHDLDESGEAEALVPLSLMTDTRREVFSSVTDRGVDVATEEDSALDVLMAIQGCAENLLPGEAAVVASMTKRVTTPDNENECKVKTWKYVNEHAGKTVILRIGWVDAMEPSVSTGLLVRHMKINPGEKFLEIGTGTGIIAFAAHILGAKPITATDIHGEFINEITVNARMNGLNTVERGEMTYLFGDMFEPLGDERYDHIVMNPPSIPTPPDVHLNSAYDSGPGGRDIIDRFIEGAPAHLNSGGRLTMVHGSLANLLETMYRLIELGFQEILFSEHEEFKFKTFYPIAHLESLSDQGKAHFIEKREQDGSITYYEKRCVVTAIWPNDKP